MAPSMRVAESYQSFGDFKWDEVMNRVGKVEDQIL
jgi:hypothetical protein